MAQGKLPPQDIEMERVVLGGLMIDKKGIDEVIDILRPEVFYLEAHQHIYNAVFQLFSNSQPVDLLTLSAQLKRDGALEKAGGDVYLIKLTQKVTSTAHIEFHSRVIVQKFIQRRLITVSNETIEQCYDETQDVFDILDKAESNIYDVAQGNLKRSAENAQSLVTKAKQRISEIGMREGMSGIATGFHKLDELTSGWQPSDLIIIAARPGMGKTAFTLSMARNIAIQNNQAVAFFSLEMSSVSLITRLISSETGLSSEKLRNGKLAEHEWTQLNTGVTDLEQAQLFIDDTPSLSIYELRAKARRLKSQHDIQIIIVDYLQLMTAGASNGAGNREQEISTISRNLKALAKELDIPVIALSQLSRAVETRTGSKRPVLSDLRESGAIEQDADIVSFIFRPEYYKMDEWDDGSGNPTAGEADFIIAKHRNGALDNVRLRFIGEMGKFDNLVPDFDDGGMVQSKMNAANDDTARADRVMDSMTPEERDAMYKREQDNAFGTPDPGAPDDDLPF